MTEAALTSSDAKPERALRASPPSDSLTRNRRILVTIGVMLALFLAALDSTIVGTALPRIVADLHGLNEFAWVVTA